MESAHSISPSAAASEHEALSRIYELLESEFGIDFSEYKRTTITRRLERRLKLARVKDIDAYVDQLGFDRAELEALHRDLLIGLTSFFRDAEAFVVLGENVLPELVLQKQQPNAELRVWVAGCATGEEAYTFAILLDELTRSRSGPSVKIFATDVHESSLEVAARGVYAEEAIQTFSRERLERYFRRRGNLYEVVPDLRQMIVFAPHDVLRDIPFTRVDLISCRNVLIYLEPSAQQKVLSHLHFALGPGGIVFLGRSESPGLVASYFDAVDRHWRIYRKHAVGSVGTSRLTHRAIPATRDGADLLASLDVSPRRPRPATTPEPVAPSRLLEIELALTKEKLQAVTEALEKSTEELRATNQELLSSNQELQRLNQEVQILNQELYSRNAEHRSTLAELAELKRR